jgi:hypothetical protein
MTLSSLLYSFFRMDKKMRRQHANGPRSKQFDAPITGHAGKEKTA